MWDNSSHPKSRLVFLAPMLVILLTSCSMSTLSGPPFLPSTQPPSPPVKTAVDQTTQQTVVDGAPELPEEQERSSLIERQLQIDMITEGALFRMKGRLKP